MQATGLQFGGFFMRLAAFAAFLAMTAPATAGDLCFSAGKTTYKLIKSGPADVRIRIEANHRTADLRMQIVEQAEIADFIIADDMDEAVDPCGSARRVTTVRADDTEPRPDVTVSLSERPEAADYKVFVRSQVYRPQDAAAILAAMWKSTKRSNVAQRR
jgi:hypothetical protein